MKKEVIIVPKDKCPLDVLAEMGERTKNSWLFFHSNIIEKLKESKGATYEEGNKQGTLVFTWEETKEYPETKIVIDICALCTEWKPVICISASDIAFDIKPKVAEQNIYKKYFQF